MNASYRKINDRTNNSSKYHKLDCTEVRAKLKEASRKEVVEHTPARGPGYARMMTRLGPERAEELRQQTLRAQEAALDEAARTRPPAERDRDSYQNYPPPRQRRD